MTLLALENVTKSYGATAALDNISLEISAGNIVRIPTKKLVPFCDILVELGDATIQLLWAEGFFLDKSRYIWVFHNLLD
jgi:hypothetical protein